MKTYFSNDWAAGPDAKLRFEASVAANFLSAQLEVVGQKAKVVGRAFKDANNNGLRDAGDAVFAGITVRLLNGTGVTVATATTDSTGAYQFDGVVPGSYTVKFDSASGYNWSLQDQGTNDAIDSDVDTLGQLALSLMDQDVRLDVDAGFVLTGSGGPIQDTHGST